jgi:hypothetical protein
LRITTKPYQKDKNTFANRLNIFRVKGYECKHAVFIFSKEKRAPFPKPSFSCFEGQISYYTVVKEIYPDHFVLDKFYND